MSIMFLCDVCGEKIHVSMAKYEIRINMNNEDASGSVRGVNSYMPRYEHACVECVVAADKFLKGRMKK